MRISLIILFVSFLGMNSLSAQNDKVAYVNFDLLNKSSVSIPLVIEGVMKPNLSPFSESGITCKVGTKVWTKGRKVLLFVVTEDLDGEVLIVNQLIDNLPHKKRREKSRP